VNIRCEEHSNQSGYVCTYMELTAEGCLTLPGKSSEMYWPEAATVTAA